MKTKDIFMSNVWLPFISVLLAFGLAWLGKKKLDLHLPKLIVFLLASSLIICLPAFLTLLEGTFFPLFYLYTQAFFLGLGFIYSKIGLSLFDTIEDWLGKTLLSLSTVAIICLGSYLFSIIFNLLGHLDYGLMASTSTYTFMLPFLFKWTYDAMAAIPSEIHKIWKFDPKYVEPDFTSEMTEQIKLLELELSKKPDDLHVIKVKAKAPISFSFGDWFHMFLYNYNSKYMDSPIAYKESNGNTYQWIFYTKTSLSLSKHFIDFEKTIKENGLDERTVIICKRVDHIAS